LVTTEEMRQKDREKGDEKRDQVKQGSGKKQYEGGKEGKPPVGGLVEPLLKGGRNPSGGGVGKGRNVA